MPSDRPYSSKPIDELEELFEQFASNRSGLKRLKDELEHRTRARANQLHAQVVARLAQLKTSKPKAESEPPAPGRRPKVESDHLAYGQLALPFLPAIEAPQPVAGDPANHQATLKAERVVPRAEPTPPPVRPGVQVEDEAWFEPMPADIEDVPSHPAPSGWNQPTFILQAWTVLEVLSPQTFRRPEDLADGNKHRIADFADGTAPWTRGEKSKPKYQLFYEVVLGSIPMAAAMERLLQVYGQDEERGLREREHAAIASFLVARDGTLLDDGGIAVSSFAWALPRALASELGKLRNWPLVEPKLVDGLRAILGRVDGDGQKRPVTLVAIAKAFEWLTAQLQLDSELVDGPRFAIRTYHYFKAKTPPEPSLLNSFYLADLAQAASLLSDGAGVGLRRYLGDESPPPPIDVLNDRQALQHLVAPSSIPAVRWPAQHPLVFLQQAAIGAIRQEVAGAAGIIAVNGPPGTGKTTLLRDLVASCVFERALALANLKDPKDGFEASGLRVPAGNAFFQLYRLAPSLRGHEVVVASSNNKAVENVSGELPGQKTVHFPPDGISYFRTLSDAIADKRLLDDEREEEVTRPKETTWGLIAAVLGNKKNRWEFQQVFWRDEDWGLKQYLRAAKGDVVEIEIPAAKAGAKPKTRLPFIIQLEHPPTEAKALANWRSARNKFLALWKTVSADLSVLEEARETQVQMQRAMDLVSKPHEFLAEAQAEYQAAGNAVSNAALKVEFAANSLHAATTAFDRHERTKPSLVERVMWGYAWTQWQATHRQLEEACRLAEREHQAATERLLLAREAQLSTGERLRRMEREVGEAQAAVGPLGSKLHTVLEALGDRFISEATFQRGHEAWNKTTPWLSEETQRKRSELFAAALALHKAFIDVNAQRIYHNLSVLMDAMAGTFPQDEARRALLGDLWSTLFLVVPVVSTTFASVNRMLGALPPESLGWLLVDEAGQAVPQAAVGAIMRSRRSVVVGDPLQIPPVVSIPERLVDEICAYHMVTKSTWAAPDASVQTLADVTSRHQAALGEDDALRRVGFPLLVHRRCAEPMFSISNKIAYGRQMVFATEQRELESIGSVLGESAWFDVEGTANSKWCRAEGDVVLSLLINLADRGIMEPDLFIISPFRVVAQELRMLIERSTALCSRLGVDPESWSRDRVGTVHTFQGREAYAVIFVLGAPMPAQHGARLWAASRPNLLNVAVSRAKERLYVVGSRQAWCNVGHAENLVCLIPNELPARL